MAVAGAAAAAFGAEAVDTPGGLADVKLWLDVHPPARPGFVPEALPPRFVLLEDGRGFVGGFEGLASFQLTKAELKALDKRVQQLKRLPGAVTARRLGPGETRYRLRIPRERVDVVLTGDPAPAPAELRVLASLVADLAAFNTPALQPLRPAQYLATAREETLAGGCRAWASWPALAEIASSPRVIPAESVTGWPAGARAASVCESGRRFTLTLRPLLPGERP